MDAIHKKIVLDEKGRPAEVIIPFEEFREMEELLGLDLDEEARSDLAAARKDRESGRKDTYTDIDSL